MDTGHLATELLRGVLFVAAAWSFLRGGGPERVGVLLLCGYFALRLALPLFGLPPSFEAASVPHAVLAGVSFLVALVLSLRSNRVWPLFFAAFALITLAGHLAVLILEEGRILAYWIMTQLPIIGQCVAVVLGAWAHDRRVKGRVNAPDWQTSLPR